MSFNPSDFYPDGAGSSSSSSSPAPVTPYLRKDELAGALDGLDPPGDGATQKAVRQALASLVGRLRSVAPLLLLLALPPAAPGAVPWEDVPPSTPVDTGTVGASLDFTNDFLRAESDPTVPAWAKAAQPPAVVEADPVFAAWRDDDTSSFAGNAARADRADEAGWADEARSADYADSAATARAAESATTAEVAGTADVALALDDSGTWVTYAQILAEIAAATNGVPRPDLAAVAYTGNFADITNVPEARVGRKGITELASSRTASDVNRAPTIRYVNERFGEVYVDMTQRVARASSSIGWATGPLALTVGASLSADLAGWPDGAAVFVRLSASGPYAVDPAVSLLGYGAWPTNSASCVAVRDGARILVHVLEGY